MFDDDGETMLERALLDAYPGSDPLRFDVPPRDKQEVVGCLAIRVEGPAPHWVVVSRGFTELGDKTGDDPEISGWGFELTCRLPARSPEPDFGWVVGWMESVAALLTERVSTLEPYQLLPIWEAATRDELAALVFVEETELCPTRSRNGYLAFHQMVGLTADECTAIEEWDARRVVELIAQRDPLLLTDARRKSYMRDPVFARAVELGREREGSSSGIRHGVPILWFVEDGEIQVHMSVEAAGLLKRAIRARLLHGKPMHLFGERRRSVRPDGSLAVRSQLNVSLYPEKGRSEIEVGEDGSKVCTLRFSADARTEVASMPEVPGSYAFSHLRGVRFVVVTAERLRGASYPA